MGDQLIQSGKHQGKTFAEVFLEYPDYTKWCVERRLKGRMGPSLKRFGHWARAKKNRGSQRASSEYRYSTSSEVQAKPKGSGDERETEFNVDDVKTMIKESVVMPYNEQTIMIYILVSQVMLQLATILLIFRL